VKSVPTEAESYATTSTRITGGIAIVVGLICLVDIAIEWRTRGGLIAAAVIAFVMVVAYVGLIRPSVTLSPERLLVRNHLRDHAVPWSDVEGVDMADILWIQLPGRRLRCPGVQLMMRDMRRQRAGRIKPDRESSVSRAEFVVGRVEHHMHYYGKTSTGEVTSRWATPELVALGVFALIALVAWLIG
jgi:Bacterial PH domain